MKISLITATYNSEKTIQDTIESVISQSYSNIEYIIKDGGSTDNTLNIIHQYNGKIANVISAPDLGIYDAINKGIAVATGDIIGILNSDDFFTSNDIISILIKEFENEDIDAIYGDVHFVNSDNLDKIVRYYSSKLFTPELFRFGFMPAHPSFYARRMCYEKYGVYSTDYKISADFDLLIRFLYKNKIKTKYLPIDFVTMRMGGASTKNIRSKIILNKEDIYACKKYGLYTNWGFMLLRYIYKLFEIRF